MRIKLFFLYIIFPFLGIGQQWVDTLYTIQTVQDVQYGEIIDFAGTSRTLHLDISYPLNDNPPECGRPLIILIHGGAWLWGDKSDMNIVRMREDFAKRGYVSVAVNYRLGQFHTNQFINCNVPAWNCFNITDTIEWYRANHRAVQDVNGAIRFLVNNSSTYNINPENIFIAGESAGGFIAMGTGFIDSESEVFQQLVDSLPDAPVPNALYENPCIQTYQLAPSIAAMDLARPALGSYEGTLNFPVNAPYTIQGVGNFYGGVYNNIFEKNNSADLPVLYLYHQLCDLVVHHDHQKLLQGYQNCMMGFPVYCGYIINRPYSIGSTSIKAMIDNMNSNSIPAPDYYFDFVPNNYNCIQQTDQGLSCHSIDNYWLRTRNMAIFFASAIDSCSQVQISDYAFFPYQLKIFPNPVQSILTIELPKSIQKAEVKIFNILSQMQLQSIFSESQTLQIDCSQLAAGTYFLTVHLSNYIPIHQIFIKEELNK